jgi:hypothetical protein
MYTHTRSSKSLPTPLGPPFAMVEVGDSQPVAPYWAKVQPPSPPF